MFLKDFFEMLYENTFVLLVALLAVADTVFGILRAIKQRAFNSSFGIDGAIRKVAMLLSLIFLLIIDSRVNINLIGFIPREIKSALGLGTVGTTEFFRLIYIAYEAVSILKNMALCGLPVKKVTEKLKAFLKKWTTELPD